MCQRKQICQRLIKLSVDKASRLDYSLLIKEIYNLQNVHSNNCPQLRHHNVFFCT